MKMISSTSITSTSGITLISARVLETRRLRPRGPPPDGIGSTFGIASRLLREVPFGDIQKLEREVIQVGRVSLYLRREVVIGHHRGNGGKQPRRRRNERVRDAGTDGGKV